jgi:nicotinamidase-related amidase
MKVAFTVSRVLLVIDVQNEYFTGALPITYPVDHFSNIIEVVDLARSKSVPTIFVRHKETQLPIFQEGTHGWQLHADLAERPCDLLLDKTLPGCFTGTLLQNWIEEHKIETLTIAGYMTHICCDTTARQGMHLGLKVEFLSDATGTLALDNEAGMVTDEELHRAILCAQQHFISEVISRKTWADRL